MQKDNIQRPIKGLHLDSSYIDSPKDTYRFALNSVTETELGDFYFLGNEESNIECTNFPEGFVPIGKEYMGNGSTIIFLVNPIENISEIGIFKDNCEYETHVNDFDSIESDKLNFNISKQIDATYRLRRGCDRTVYFTDNFNKPRYYNFDKPDDFKNNDGTWASSKFNLQKHYKKIPIFQKIEVLDSGGNLEPGSYNISIQYLDSSLNPTEWIVTSDIIKIYNDSQTKPFNEINGSINSDIQYINFPQTSKAIKVTFESNSLDRDYSYYRLAIIEASSGSGLINKVNYTEVIPISKNFFIYTGDNSVSLGTKEEIAQFSNIIDRAGSIEQIENRLILGNLQNQNVDLCNLQKYASRIKADCITKTIVLNDIVDNSNPKNPTHNIYGRGYMPGEIYSFGIVYIFEDNTLSPVYHIPGKSQSVLPNTIFSSGINTYPMGIDNLSENTTYIPDNCTNDFWGLDSEGDILENTYVRHHRFPLRSQIDKPLVVDTLKVPQTTNYYQLSLQIQGTLIVPYCDINVDPNCTPSTQPSFEVRVTYKVDGQLFSFTQVIDPNIFASGNNPDYVIDLVQLSQVHTSSIFTDISFNVTDINGNYQSEIPLFLTIPETTTQDNIYFTDNATYTITVQPYTSTIQEKIYTTEILGIKFSGIDLPPKEETNNKSIIGYYIVRNERTEFEKTILDTGVLTQCTTNNNYVSHGLLQPDSDNISSSIYSIIHPEHKFNNKQYTNYDKIIQQGNFIVEDTKYGKVNYDDVHDGSSYQSKYQKGGNDDGLDVDGSNISRGYDGWSFNLISRDNIVSYRKISSFNIDSTDIKDRFYLDALESKPINDSGNNVYNVACDNKIGIIQFNQDNLIGSNNNLPYILLYRNNSDPYSNFRLLPYYKETLNPIYFSNIDSDTCSVFGGDTYITPMKYVNTIFYKNRIAKRAGKRGIIKIIIGVALTIMGALLVATGVLAGAGALVISAGVTLIGGAILIASSGIKQETFNKTYNEEYDKGLRETITDNWVDSFYNYKDNSYTNGIYGFGFSGNGEHGQDGPSDDTIQWVADCVSDIWCESSVNMSLRNHFIDNTSPTYLNAPSKIESGNNTIINTWEFFGIMYTNSNTIRYPISKLEKHVVSKLLAFDSTRDDNRLYLGMALGEYYNINPDYNRENIEKIFYHLPLEYDCCSDCREKFPHRVQYSEQSYQEELSDNYRVFLPNNYRDIDGETGEITNLFKIGNNLFIHTKEGLWQQPRNYQERVTDQIISFIGTGSYFEIPPQKILDDNTGSSAGCQHKWSAIKTPNGYFFVSENQRVFYRFDGNNLLPISSQGLYNWFFKNIQVSTDYQYYKDNNVGYPYSDNPSNPIGTGFITVYDPQKERIILTKRDFILSENIGQVCTNGDSVISFNNINNTINFYENLGWEYIGIESCQLKFKKVTTKIKTETRDILSNIPNNTDIVIWLDTSFSFDAQARQTIKDAIGDPNNIPSLPNSWLAQFSSANPDWQGTLYYVEHPDQITTERWLLSLEETKNIIYGGNISGKDIILVSFVNESATNYHTSVFDTDIDAPTSDYSSDLTNFISNYNLLNKFNGLCYPVISTAQPAITNEYLKHVLAAIKGVPYTALELSNLDVNTFMTPADWSTLILSLQGANPYDDYGLSNYNWNVITNRGWSGTGEVITAQQFQEDMSNFLTGLTVIEQIEVDVEYLETEYLYVDGDVLETNINNINNSWTISYSLKNNTWTSWHSYLPNFYINTSSKWFSWIPTPSNNVWQHNIRNNFQTYYNTYYPHIIEYVSLSNPIITRLWNHIRLITEARKFDIDTQEYYDIRFVTFNKAILYNSRQCSGILNIIVKDTQQLPEEYLFQQIINPNDGSIIADRTERDWLINDIRDIRIDYNKSIWDSNINNLQNEYYIDKILNLSTLDINKDWTELENFRDKYLVIRLIFDNFADTKLITNYSIENEQQSLY